MAGTRPEFDEFIRPPKRFRAKGNTFVHRDEIVSWGWHWNQREQCWETEDESADEICVRAAANLKGVVVEEVQQET